MRPGPPPGGPKKSLAMRPGPPGSGGPPYKAPPPNPKGPVVSAPQKFGGVPKYGLMAQPNPEYAFVEDSQADYVGEDYGSARPSGPPPAGPPPSGRPPSGPPPGPKKMPLGPRYF
jgi:hypothetical protein